MVADPVGALDQLIGRIGRSQRVQTVRLLVQSSRPLAACLMLDVVLGAVLPVIVLVAAAAVIGRIPAGVAGGYGSPAGDRLFETLPVLGVTMFASMLAVPFHDWLTTVVKLRLTWATRERLMEAVSRPVEIAHLEDAAVLDRLALAQGNLMTFFPAEAPTTLATVMSNRLAWLAGCAVVASFRWWLGLALVLAWQICRPRVLRVIKEHVAAFGGNVAVMRRADYFRELATRPPASKELRIFGLGGWVVDRYRANWIEGMAEVWRIRSGMSATLGRVALLLLAVYSIASTVIAKAAFDGDIGLEQVAALVPMLFLTVTSGGVSFDDLSLEWQLSALPELDDLEQEMTGRRSALTGTREPPAKPMAAIRFESVSFRYPGSEANVLDGLDLDIPSGRSTAIVGANGVGKTTLVKLLARLHDPTEGRITVAGIPLDKFEPGAWQRNVGVVFQDFTRFPLTAAENIGLGAVARLPDREGIAAAAERAGVRHMIESLPAGWDTPLTPELSGGVELSGGQWQRVALARALFAADNGASILVLDEPTAWLDVRGEAQFFEQFLELTSGITTIVISHRFSTVRLADQICVIGDGRAIELGSHDSLLEHDGVYARMFRLQAARFAQGGADE
jgi:ATP-binding cassette subfamily B protein